MRLSQGTVSLAARKLCATRLRVYLTKPPLEVGRCNILRTAAKSPLHLRGGPSSLIFTQQDLVVARL